MTQSEPGCYGGVMMTGNGLMSLDMLLLFVRDLEQEIAFWHDVVGLPLAARHGDSFAELDMGNGRRLGLHGGVASPGADKDPHRSGGGYIPAFTCEDIEAAVRRLDERGVRLVNRQDQPYALILTYADPEGNLFELTKTT